GLRRCRAFLGTSPRRVRGDDHVRGESSGDHADPSARCVHRPRDASRGRDHAEPRPARGGARDPRPHARPVPTGVLMLTARVAVRLGTLDLDVAVDAAPGEIVSVLWPNGAGKTTFLRAVAGLVALDRGRVDLDDVVLEDASGGFRVSPARRPSRAV